MRRGLRTYSDGVKVGVRPAPLRSARTPARITMPSEFDLIRRHFTRTPRHTVLAVGDDAALLQPRAGMQLAVSTDMLVAGTHFFADTDACDLGWKALAVNVSDLAAMGAEPRWAFLALALPAPDEDWIAAFAEGFFACAERFGVDLAGGDTTRGPLTLSVTIAGVVPPGSAITRTGAQAGDELWVSGQPGLAALGLAALRGEHPAFSIDAEGHIEDERIQAVLIGLHRVCPSVIFLGSYPSASGKRIRPRPGTADADFISARRWVAGLLGRSVAPHD